MQLCITVIFIIIETFYKHSYNFTLLLQDCKWGHAGKNGCKNDSDAIPIPNAALKCHKIIYLIMAPKFALENLDIQFPVMSGLRYSHVDLANLVQHYYSWHLYILLYNT